jgi:hypothetical protein
LTHCLGYKKAFTHSCAVLLECLVDPVTVVAKMILQEVWASKIDWDDSLPSTILSKWSTSLQNFITLNSLTVPRKVINNKFYIRAELDGFSNSSQNAYGACIYLRTIDNNGQVHCHLLCAKNKVAPLKTITIPRLELSAAVLLSQLLNKVKNNLNITINDCCYWTDSTIVLCLIKMQTNSLKTFVAHRVATIQNLTSSDNWRYINSTENPADILSRRTNPQKLQNNNLWWFGPQFLSQNNLDLSSSIKQPYQCPAEIPEIKTTCANNAVAIPKFNFISLYKYSSFKKCLRVTAYVLRFIHNIRNPTNKHITAYLAVSEIRNAHSVVIKLTQSESFAEDIRMLKKHGELPKGSKLIKLNAYIKIKTVY